MYNNFYRKLCQRRCKPCINLKIKTLCKTNPVKVCLKKGGLPSKVKPKLCFDSELVPRGNGEKEPKGELNIELETECFFFSRSLEINNYVPFA